MNISIEQRLTNLENEIKSLKMVHPISGGSVESAVTSAVITMLPGAESIQVLFTPNSDAGQTVTVYSVYAYEQNGSSWDNISAYLLPQDGGSIVIDLPEAIVGNTYKIEMSASVAGSLSQNL